MVSHFAAGTAASPNGQDAVLSRPRREFDSPRCYQDAAIVIGGATPGRSMVGRGPLKLGMSVRFAPRQPSSCVKFRGVRRPRLLLFPRTIRVWLFPPQHCEVIQLARMAGSDPAHARSNRALAAKVQSLKRSQSLAAGCLTVYQEGRVQLPLRPPRG